MHRDLQRQVVSIHASRMLFVAVVCATVGVTALGQQPVGPLGSRVRRSGAVAVFLPAPRELQRELSRAKEDVSQERYVDAIARLDLILRGGDGEDAEFAEDYFLPTNGPSLKSLKLEAERVISAMPRVGIEAYELAHGTDARQLLNAALAKRDFTALGEISRRYAHTRAGQEATLLLGRESLSRGNALQAAMHFQRLNESDSAVERFGGELQLLLATALRLSDRVASARDVLDKHRARDGKATVLVAGKPEPWFEEDGKALGWLSNMIGDIEPEDAEQVEDWRLFGGNPQRAAITDAEMPLKMMRWDLPVAIEKGEPEELARHGKALKDLGVTPAWHPLVVDDWVLMRSTDHLWGVSLETGKRVWSYLNTKFATAQTGGSFASVRNRRSDLVKKRVWEDSLYGQISSDGKRVFLLSELTGNYYGGRNSEGLNNNLVALELERQGYLLWSVGGRELDDEPKLAGVFFLGAPLPVGKDLYVVGELNGEIRLFCLDPSDRGKLLWSQQLAHVDIRPGMNGAPRRMSGLNLCYADGILVCPTSVGGVVAVDLARRTFRWGFQYSKTTGRTPNISRSQSGNRWRDNSLLIGDGKVIVTPWDSAEVYCRDLLTGKNVWTRPRPRGDLIYSAGIHDGKVILVGRSRVTAVNLADGKDAWTLPLQNAPSGRGVQSGSSYLLATVAPSLIEIDLSNGRVTNSIRTDEPLGNLVVARGHVISQNEKRLRAFYQAGKLHERVDEILATRPNDAWALEHKAILLLEWGQRLEALASLRKAIETYPDIDSMEAIPARELFVTTALELLRDNEPGTMSLAREIEPLIRDQPQRRKEYLRVLTMNLRREGRIVEAARRNLDLFLEETRQPGNEIVRDRVELMSVTTNLKLRQDRWHRAFFRNLWRDANEDERREIKRVCLDTLGVVAPIDVPRLAGLLQDLPFTSETRLRVIRGQIADGTTTATTESELLRLAELGEANGGADGTTSARVISGQATQLLCELYETSGKYVAAAAGYRKLSTEFADTKVVGEQTGAEVASAAIEKNAGLRRFAYDRATWNYGEVQISPLTETPRGPGARLVPNDKLTQTILLDTEQPFARKPFGMQLVLSNQVNKLLQGRDAMGNAHLMATLNSVLPAIRRGSDLRVRTNGHYVVATRGESIVAINALAAKGGEQEAIVWSDGGLQVGPPALSLVRTIRFGELGQSLSRTVESGRNQISPVSLGPVTDHGIIVRRYSDLICLDPITGEIVWVRDDVDMASEIWGDNDYVFVHVPARTNRPRSNARVFSTMDGTEQPSCPVPEQGQRIRTGGRFVLTHSLDIPDELPDPDEVLAKILTLDLDKPDLQNYFQPNFRSPIDAKDSAGVLVNRVELSDILNRDSPVVWRKQIGMGSRAALVGESEMAIYDPDAQKIQIFSLRDGNMLVDYPVETELDQVYTMRAEKRAGMYVVTLSERSTGKRGTKSVYRMPNAMKKPENMEVYAFDSSGKMAWGVPAKLKDFMQGEFYAADVPVLIYIRWDQSAPKKQLDTVVLDVRDGHVIHTDSSQADGNTFQVRGDPELNEVHIRVPAQDGNWKLTFTEQPRSPSPPFGYASATRRGGTVLDKAFDVLRDVFSETTEIDEEGDLEIDDLFK